MKKRSTLYLFLMLVCSSTLYSQNPTILFNVGVGSSQLSIKYNTGIPGIDTSYSSNAGLSYFVGAEYKHNFTRKFSMGISGGLCLRAASFDVDSIVTSSGIMPSKFITDNFLYIQIKLHPDYEFPISQQFSGDIFGGAYLGLLLDANENISESFSSRTYNFKKSIKSYINNIDAGFYLGAGIRVTRFLYVKASYQAGLTNILNNSFGLNGVTSKNHSIYLVLSIKNNF